MARIIAVTQRYLNGQSQPKTVYLNADRFKDVSTIAYPTQIISLTMSAALVTSNSVAGNINGTALTATIFATDSDTTLAAIATKIAAVAGVQSATVTSVGGTASDDRTIVIVPTDPVNGVSVDSFVTTLGASQNTWSVSYAQGTFTGSNIQYIDVDSTNPEVITVSNTKAALLTLQNAANTTNGITAVAVVRVNDDATTTALTIPIVNIIKIEAYPTDTNDGLLSVIGGDNEFTNVFRTQETAAVIAAAANA
jgi:hypothetical protein